MSYSIEKENTSFDTLFEALADDQRRSVLSYLEDTPDDVASREELASFVSSRVPDSPSQRRVTVSLHHVTLPKLASAGLLEYDPRSMTVRYRGHRQLATILDEIDDRE